jgi:thioredoxin-dependent peroxiredoxin
MLQEGKKAPQFSLPDKNGEIHVLADYLGKWVLVYFYPKDNTPGCTKEACGIRDLHKEFEKANIIALGISKDSQASHQKFVEKYDLPFTILSDEDKSAHKKYDVWAKKKMMGREYMGALRKSFLVDPKGKLVKIYHKVKPVEHAQQVLDDVNSLN